MIGPSQEPAPPIPFNRKAKKVCLIFLLEICNIKRDRKIQREKSGIRDREDEIQIHIGL